MNQYVIEFTNRDGRIERYGVLGLTLGQAISKILRQQSRSLEEITEAREM